VLFGRIIDYKPCVARRQEYERQPERPFVGRGKAVQSVSAADPAAQASARHAGALQRTRRNPDTALPQLSGLRPNYRCCCDPRDSALPCV